MGEFIGENSIVTILDIDLEEEYTYKIVNRKTGEENELHCTSALGRALVEKGEEGKILKVYPAKERGGEPYCVKILKIESPVQRKREFNVDFIQPPLFTETEKRQRILEKRQIKRLVHFTRLENLQSILTRGIWTRQYLDKHANVPYIINDQMRLDGKPYCTSLSVSFPNYKMLSYLKQQNPDGRWVLLLINPQVLCDEKKYLYCSKGNAARLHGRTLSSGADAFERIFEEPLAKQGVSISRKELGLNDWEPTNPQAEVLLSEKIETKDIEGIVFENYQDFYWFKKIDYGNKLNNFYFVVDDDNESGNRWFESRRDYKYWQKIDD